MVDKYKGWDLLEELPQGWAIDKTAGTPLNGYVFITNGKSVLNGQERALLKVNKNIAVQNFKAENTDINLEKNIKKINLKDKIIDKKQQIPLMNWRGKNFKKNYYKILESI